MMSLRVLAFLLLATGVSAECDAQKYAADAGECSKKTTKCTTDAGSDVAAICKCGDDLFSCTEKAVKDTGCADAMKDSLDKAKKMYEDNKAASGCDSAGAMSWKSVSWMTLLAAAVLSSVR